MFPANPEDAQHLRLLSIFHYVLAVLAAFFSLLALVWLIFVVVMFTSPEFAGGRSTPPPAGFAAFFIAIGVGTLVIGWAYTVCVFLAGRYIAQRRHYWFCMVMAGLSCAFQPFGTVLGVFTIVVLLRPSVKAAFGLAQPVGFAPPQPPAPPGVG